MEKQNIIRLTKKPHQLAIYVNTVNLSSMIYPQKLHDQDLKYRWPFGT